MGAAPQCEPARKGSCRPAFGPKILQIARCENGIRVALLLLLGRPESRRRKRRRVLCGRRLAIRRSRRIASSKVDSRAKCCVGNCRATAKTLMRETGISLKPSLERLAFVFEAVSSFVHVICNSPSHTFKKSVSESGRAIGKGTLPLFSHVRKVGL